MGKLSSFYQSIRYLCRLCGRVLPETRHTDERIFYEPGAHLFFGYYDVTPFSPDQSRLLAMRVKGPNVSPHDRDEPLEIGYYNLDEEETAFNKLAETPCWNWQQGCRLQWLPGHTDCVIYNTLANGSYVSVVQNVRSGEITQTLSQPIYAVDPAGRYTLSLNFSRLHHFRRGYGYHQLPDPGTDIPAPEDDGVFVLDISQNKSALVLSLKDIAGFENQGSPDHAFHYINHLEYSPDGKRIMFFHLFNDPAGKRRVRLMTADPDGGNLCCLHYDIRPSHYCWVDGETLLVTGENSAGDVRYILWRDQSEEIEIVGQTTLNEDGHPHVLSDSRIVSDTYPDIWGRQTLFVYDRKANTKRILNRIYHPPSYSGECRCDFHPRLNASGRLICFDHVYRGKRALCVRPYK